MPKDTRITTHARARAHEDLFPRLAALTAQAEAVARRRPETAVPTSVAILAEGLLYEARALLGRAGRRGLVPAAPDYAGLAALLGQALAGLEAFEARHAPWDTRLKCFAWRLPHATNLPVRRLRPVNVATTTDPAEKQKADAIRDALVRRMRAKNEESHDIGYEKGLAAARAEALAAAQAAEAARAAADPRAPRITAAAREVEARQARAGNAPKVW